MGMPKNTPERAYRLKNQLLPMLKKEIFRNSPKVATPEGLTVATVGLCAAIAHIFSLSSNSREEDEESMEYLVTFILDEADGLRTKRKGH